jgi:hypothetical protein
MLARRFTIVCLLMTLFGMAFAILVAEAGRTGRHYQTAGMHSCLPEQKIFCCPRTKTEPQDSKTTKAQ